MTISRPNAESRYPAAVNALLSDRRVQYVMMDIGARQSLQKSWRPLLELCDIIGFEPDAAECNRVNELYSKVGLHRVRVYPTAIAGSNGPRTFYVTQSPASSGLYRVDEKWLSRFPFTTMKVESEIQIDAVTLDKFCTDASLDHVDFIKIDVEGAEFDVLHGGRGMLESKCVLGIFTEFWWDPIIKGQHGFAEIDTLMRENGFRFFDLELHRYPRSVLPAGRLLTKIGAQNDRVIDANKTMDKRLYGQAWTGDALYFRDPVGELASGRLHPMWNRETLLRLCGLMDVYDYGDCALEILETFRDSLLAGVQVDPLMDALVPVMDGQLVPYGTYRGWSVQARQALSTAQYNLTDWQPPPTGYRGKS